jgi:uncharacterized YccA/Bax inhibitor family protein
MNTRNFGNPAFSEHTFDGASGPGAMTHAGVARWLALLLLCFGATFAFTMNEGMKALEHVDFNLIEDVTVGTDDDGEDITERRYRSAETGELGELPDVNLDRVTTLMWVGCLGGFVVAMICIFNKPMAPFLSPIYALLEGLALGGISAAYELEFGGIVMQAGASTFAVAIVMYLLYVTGVVRVNGFMMNVILGCLFAVLLVYVADLVAPMLGGEHFSFVHSNSWTSIGFSVFVCGLGAMCLAVDYESIDIGVRRSAPKYMEAYCAFSVMVTLVWLYLEILRLIAKSRSRK